MHLFPQAQAARAAGKEKFKLAKELGDMGMLADAAAAMLQVVSCRVVSCIVLQWQWQCSGSAVAVQW